MSKRTPKPTAAKGKPWANGDGGKVRLFMLQYAPGKKLFQMIVKLSDAPGSYRSILDLLSSRVNLVGTSTYSLEDGTAIFSGVSEALSKKETAEGLKALILSSKAAMDAEVREGRDGLLVDTFHSGPEIRGESYMLFSREGHRHMFTQIVRMLGSGGETLLFNEGEMLGRMSAQSLTTLLGPKRMREEVPYLAHFITARGWGKVEMDPGAAGPLTRITVSNCFECAGESTSRSGCSFFRGYFTGAGSVVDGSQVVVKETKCKFKGAPACEFVATRAQS